MYKLLKFNLARNALKFVIRTYKINELYIPYYLCEVIRKSVISENCKPLFYHIDKNFYPVQNFSETSFILYPNYFGICENNVKKLSAIYKNLIVDTAHSFYSKPSGIATFNSARKFLPVYNGSYLWIKDNKISFDFPEDNFNNHPKNEEEKIKNEIILNSENIKSINHKIDKQIVNINNNSDRLKIFNQIHEKLQSSNLLFINKNNIVSPFCYPLLLKNEDEANKFVDILQNQGFTIYRYWEKLPQHFFEYNFYSKLVPIPLEENILKIL